MKITVVFLQDAEGCSPVCVCARSLVWNFNIRSEPHGSIKRQLTLQTHLHDMKIKKMDNLIGEHYFNGFPVKWIPDLLLSTHTQWAAWDTVTLRVRRAEWAVCRYTVSCLDLQPWPSCRLRVWNWMCSKPPLDDYNARRGWCWDFIHIIGKRTAAKPHPWTVHLHVAFCWYGSVFTE